MSSSAELSPEEKANLEKSKGRWLQTHSGTKQVLILQTKHDSFYYLIEFLADLEKTALAILKMQNDNHAYDMTFDWAEEDPPEKPETPKGTVFQNKRMERANEEDWESYEHQLSMYKGAQHFTRMFKIAIEQSNGWLAYELLRLRSNHEYERVTTHTLETIPA